MTDPRIQELLDRQAILDVVYRYSRGIDRHDLDLVASCYHPDALDDHGSYVGPGRGLAAWAIERQDGAGLIRAQNHITNHVVELDGDTAHGETYYLNVSWRATGSAIITSGRYIDRFERRDGDWRIAARICTVEAVTEVAGADMTEREKLFAPVTKDRSDLSYQRPLRVRRTAQDAYPVSRRSIGE